MCGIIGYTGGENAVPRLLEGLESLEYRGYDSAGIAVFDGNNTLKVVKSKGRLALLRDKIDHLSEKLSAHCGIGHTRWATHGEPSDINAHPHGTPRVYIVHNGIIENYHEIKDFLVGKNYDFVSETDTEIAAKLIDYYFVETGDPTSAMQKALSHLTGSYGLGVIFAGHPDTIYAARKDSPLILALSDNGNFIASDIPAVLKYTNRYCRIDEGELAIVTPSDITVLSRDGKPVEKKIETADWDVEAAEKGGYPHFMIKEIHEEPDAIIKTVRPRVKNGMPDFGIPELTDERLASFERIHVVACGTAMHAGLVGKYAVEKLARVPVNVEIASEFRYKDPILGKNDLVIIVSQSGETADTLAALRLAKERGVYTLAIVNVAGSSIAREADSVIYTWAGPEISVATTKAYSAQLSALYLISVKIARVRGLISIGDERALCAELQRLPECIEQTLKCQSDMQRIATLYANRSSVFFLGRGLDYAAALEASLKLKEISYIHSEAYAAGELKHGTISLIEEGTLVVALATQPALFEKTVSNIREVVARGASVVLVTTDDFTGDESVCQHIVRLPKCLYEFSASLSIIPMQLLAYYIAVERNCDVDKPRNLAKSVTVE